MHAPEGGVWLIRTWKKKYCGVCLEWYWITRGKLRVSEGEVVRVGPERPNSSWLGQA
jgi:hypothetical protein